MTRKNPAVDPTARAMARKYQAGRSIADLATEYETSATTVRRRLTVVGVLKRRKRTADITAEQIKRMVADYEAGGTIRKVADAHGYSYGVVQRILADQGVSMRGSRGTPPGAPTPIPTPAAPEPDAREVP